MNQENYIKKWLNGSLSAEELKALRETEDGQFLENLDQSLKHFKAPDFNTTQEFEKLEVVKKKSGKEISWPKAIFRVAASLLIIALGAVYYFQVNQPNLTEVASNDKSTLLLPDSSYVALNVDSRLSYQGESWKHERNVQLDGEAYFKVRSGSRFDVVTTLGTVSVIGTQFNVKSRGDLFEVSCFEGKVKVKASGEETVLTKNQTWRSIKGVGESVDLKLQGSPSWTRGESKYQSVPLSYVLEELERQYHVKVNTNNIDTRQVFTGAFTHDNINLALMSISLPLNLSFKVEENKIWFYSK